MGCFMNIKTLLFSFIIIFMIGSVHESNAQLWKKLKEAAQRTAERKLEQKTEKETEEAMDEVLEGKSDSEKENNQDNANTQGNATNAEANSPAVNSSASINSTKSQIQVFSKSDFVAGENTLFFEDFSQDEVGDFPALWNTDFSGEVVSVGNNPNNKWLKMINNSFYYPEIDLNLPDNYTLEFDFFSTNLSNNTSSTSYFMIMFNDGSVFSEGKTYAYLRIPFVKYVIGSFRFRSREDNTDILNNSVSFDIRDVIHGKNRVSINVNKQRFRFYLNGVKMIDLPRFMPSASKLKKLYIQSRGLGADENIYVRNIRIAEGKPDVRSKLFAEGKFTTDAIHFDVNSANIKPESYGILKQIADAMKQESSKTIKIIGHTDSDGNDDSNMQLSKERALSVKSALVDDFGVDGSKILTDGKGETDPMYANDSALNKAKNRRVEFVIQN